MSDIKIIELEEADMMTNDQAAAELREQLAGMGVFMLNVMGSRSRQNRADLSDSREAEGILCRGMYVYRSGHHAGYTKAFRGL